MRCNDFHLGVLPATMRYSKFRLKFFLGSVAVMTAYETLKEVFLGDISKWESHMMTVLVVSIGVVIAFCFLRKNEEQLELASTVFDIMDDAVEITDQKNRIIRVNPSFTKITGYTAAEVIGKQLQLRPDGMDETQLTSEQWKTFDKTGSWCGEIRNRRKTGEAYVAWLSIKRVRDISGQSTYHVVVFSDVTERTASTARLQYLAHHDSLTDLPNRIAFADRLQQAIVSAKRAERQVAVLYLDLDKFKPVNDTYGHQVGDLLLKEVAARLLSCVRDSDTVARIGGDEFLILLPSVETEKDALHVGEKIHYQLTQAFEISDFSLHISSSIGIALFPEHGMTQNVLIEHADVAMYEAKTHGRDSVRLFDPNH